MPLISRVEARSTRGRLIHAAIILVLCVGAVTMIYPFVIMISGSFRSEMDGADLDVVPDYFANKQVLYRKFLETKYNQQVLDLNAAHLNQNFSFKLAQIPDRYEADQATIFAEFLGSTDPPRHWQGLGAIYGIKTIPENLRRLRDRLSDRFDGDLDAFGQEVGSAVTSWGVIVFKKPPAWVSKQFDFTPNAIFDAYFELLEAAPLAERQWMSLSGHFLNTMVGPRYGTTSVKAYNDAHAVQLETLRAFRLPAMVPGEDEPTLRAEWIEFVLEELNPAFLVLDGVSVEMYRAFLKDRYTTIDRLNEAWSTEHARFDQVDLPGGQWLSGSRRVDYQEFVRLQPVEAYRLEGPEFAWRDWLRERYGDLASVNAALGTDHGSIDQVWMPIAQHEYRHVLENAKSLRWTYATRNYINVVRELFQHGRAFLNTAIFCLLAITAALLLNPLAAYAMSRFQLPGTYKILLLLMATMSFPPMVTMIPTFIMLREMSLLNTFGALVLPIAVNGYLIFLLKGFFDSLPKDLYDSARIDGASELRMFFQITLALSKPILAVVGLNAFNLAYMMFLHALIVCPAENMWLISVWLFQWQEKSDTGGIFASVLVASVPTLLVFVVAQRTIMRGIVVPIEK